MSREIPDCLKRQRDICVKNVIPSQNTAFMFTPDLIGGRIQTFASIQIKAIQGPEKSVIHCSIVFNHDESL